MRKFLLLSIFTLCLFISKHSYAKDARGDWSGIILGIYNVQIHIEEDENHKLTGYLVKKGQFQNKQILNNIQNKDDELSFTIDSEGVKFNANWDEESKRWLGKWQNGGVINLNLNDIKYGELSSKNTRPQDYEAQVSEKPYWEKNVIIQNTKDRLVISGTLSVPNGDDEFPAVVLISGTGANNRNYEFDNHKYFLVLSDYLNRNGIATLRYDKRGVANSNGDNYNSTTKDYAYDVDLIVNYLAQQPKIDKDKIGLIGHSEGGVIAPIVANRNSNVKYLVSLAGPIASQKEIFEYQFIQIMKENDISKSDLKKAIQANKLAMNIAQKSKTTEEAQNKLKPTYSMISNLDFSNQITIMTFNNSLTFPWTLYFLKQNFANDLMNLKKPILFMNGTLDKQVPTSINLPVAQKLLAKNKNAKIVSLPNLNHFFQNAKTGSKKEYSSINETFSPDAMLIIADWIKAR